MVLMSAQITTPKEENVVQPIKGASPTATQARTEITDTQSANAKLALSRHTAQLPTNQKALPEEAYATDPPLSFFALLRLVLLVLCIYGLSPLSTNPQQRQHKNPYSSYRFAYFTNISLVYTIFTTSLGLRYRQGWLFRYAVATSPVFNMITTMIFWALFFSDKSLIVSKGALQSGCHTFLLTELCIHFFPLLLSAVEHWDIYLEGFQFRELAGLWVFCALYLAMAEIMRGITGVYPYPFMNKLNSTGYVIFCIAMFLVAAGFYGTVVGMNRICHWRSPLRK